MAVGSLLVLDLPEMTTLRQALVYKPWLRVAQALKRSGNHQSIKWEIMSRAVVTLFSG